MIDTIKALVHGVRNKQTVTINLTITVIGVIAGIFIGITQLSSSIGFGEALASIILCALIGGSFVTFFINMVKRWFGMMARSNNADQLVFSMLAGGIIAGFIELFLAIFRTIKTLILDTKYLVGKEYENEQEQ